MYESGSKAHKDEFSYMGVNSVYVKHITTIANVK